MASFAEALPPARKLSDLSTVASAAAEHQSLLDNVFDHDDISGRTGEKKPAWSKPSGSRAVEVGPVMGAVSWPALTKSAQASPKPLSSASGSPQDQSLFPGPLISSSPKKTITSSQSPNSKKNHPASTRQKSGRRSGMVNGGIGPASDEQQQAAEVAVTEPGNRTNPNEDNGFSSGGADHNRSNFGGRRGSGGGNGSQRNRFGHRRDHDFGHRSFNGRDSHIQLPQHPRGGGPRPFPRPVPASVAGPIIGPHHLHGQPFRPMTGFHDLNSPLYPFMPHQTLESYGAVAFVPHAMPAAMIFPAVDPSHRAALLKQIDYYFSTENLCKDIYLRQQMNDQGWVPISLIAGFNKVKQLTNNIHYIFDTVQYSTAVEVQGDKIRRRNDWMNWVLPQPNNFGSVSCPQSPATPNYDTLAVHLQGFSLDEGDTNNRTRRISSNTVVPISRPSGDSDEQSHVPPDTYGDPNGQFYGHSDRYIRSTRSLSRSDTF